MDAEATTRARLAEAGIDLARLGVDAEGAVRHVVSLGAEGSEHLADVILAFAASEGSAVGLAAVDRRLGNELAGALSRLRLSRSDIDEVGQTLRERLFVRKGDARPKIRSYAGQGSLEGWLRAVIVRAGINLCRARPAEHGADMDDEPLLSLADPTADPELEQLRARHAPPFKSALYEAIRGLPVDERNALRLNVVDGLNIDQIGGLYGVHRATVARWLKNAKDTIGERTRKILRERLALRADEVESLVGLCRSRVELGPSLFEG